MNTAADPFAPYRRRLLGLAYRMLGDRCEAEDVLQDAFLRYAAACDIVNLGAFLTTTVTRLCLDRLKSARVQRETYIGPWLPDPVLDGSALSPGTTTELADDLSFALMLTFERLKPAERAAFLLHDVFDLGRVDKRDSQTVLVLIQDCSLGSSHGPWGLVGCGMGTDRTVAAV